MKGGMRTNADAGQGENQTANEVGGEITAPPEKSDEKIKVIIVKSSDDFSASLLVGE
jgi:hypothetical protein